VTNPASRPGERVHVDTAGSDATVICLLCDGNVTIDLDSVGELADNFEQFVREHRDC
jgi:hypothetical protein